MYAISKQRILFYASSIVLVVLFAIFKVLSYLPFMEKPICKLMQAVATIKMEKDQFWDNLFSWEMLKANLEAIVLDLERVARPGKPSPNPALVTLDGRKQDLLDCARGSRPLVVNIGSRTCPVFMKRLSEFNSIVEDFSAMADFVTVYIKEAHPSDGWKLEGNINLAQAQTQDERCSAARTLRDLNKLHSKSALLVDTMENCANTAFGGLPIRLYIVQHGEVQYGSAMGPTFYRTEEVRRWLYELRIKSNRQRA